MNSQESAILRWLRKGRPLTSLQALDEFGCLRLAARVRDLKAKGHPIQCTMVRRGAKRLGLYSMRAT